MRFAIRPHILRMRPYSPGKPIEEVQRELGLTDVVKLASNENPLGPSPKAVAAVERAARAMHLYPDASGFALKRAIADRFAVDPARIVLGNGSDEIIHLLGQVFLGRAEDEVVVGEPTFVRYAAAAQLNDCRLVSVPLDAEMKHDTAAMAAACGPSTKLAWIANPNNPTGTIVTRREVDRLLAALPEGAVLVLDEAYFEFAENEPDFPNALNYLREGAPVIGLRTFSKTYGLAGIRVGYGFAPPEVVDAIDRIREPFNVNSLAQAAAIAALEDEEHLRRTIEVNRRGLDRITAAFREVGARPVPSFANFVLADLGRPARPVFEALLRQGVIVRSGEAFGLPNCLRVSVGTEAEVERFVAALQSVLSPT